MAFQATLTQLIDILKALPISGSEEVLNTCANGITTDSRAVQPGQVFVALRGETFDGHSFVETALEQGAIAAIVDSTYPIPMPAPRSPLLQVPDTLQAYQAIAHWWRNQFSIPVIAVTGSVGKTTTKELIAAVLEACAKPEDTGITSHAKFKLLKSQANFNNEIGVPKTLLELGSEHSYAIVEMGMRGRGEIALLCQIARPTLAVITNVGTAHIERLGSEQAIAEAKCELLAEMPSDGTAILNHDTPRLIQTAATVWHGNTVTFGLEGGDLQGHLDDRRPILSDQVPETVRADGITLPLPLPGRHNAINYLAALAVAKTLGFSWETLTQGLAVELPSGRAKRLVLPNDIVILDETYNAGLESMLASVHLLAQMDGKRRIAVLGTMKELGTRSPEFHHRVGTAVQQLGLDYLLILAEDPEASALKAGAGNVPSECFSHHADIVKWLKAFVQPGDRLLFKASRAVGLEHVVSQFCQ